jgi:hypothetical protein
MAGMTFYTPPVKDSELRKQCKNFKKMVKEFQPESREDCPEHFAKMLKNLFVIEQLAEIYMKFEIFRILASAKEIFVKKLTKHIPTIKDDINFAEFAYSARGILGHREDNIRHIQEMQCEPTIGIDVTPNSISRNLKGGVEKSRITREDLRNAVEYLNCLHQANRKLDPSP